MRCGHMAERAIIASDQRGDGRRQALAGLLAGLASADATGLRALLMQKYAVLEPDLAVILGQYVAAPEISSARLEQILSAVGADRDAELLAQVHDPLDRVQSQQSREARLGISQVNAPGGRIVI